MADGARRRGGSSRRKDRAADPRRCVWLRAAATLGAAALLAYGALWADLPLRRTLAETVLTSQHHQWARLLATPAELRVWGRSWAQTPDLQVITPTVPPAAGAAPSAPGVAVEPLSGPTYRGWLLIVRDPGRIVVGTSDRLGSFGEQPSQMGARLGAVAAVNGGGFMDPYGEGYGGAPIGVTLSLGRVVPADPDDGSDYVIGFDLHDRLVAGKWTIAGARAAGIRDAVSFKPLLLRGGQPQITAGDGGWGVGPRTAIGQRADGTVLFVVIDGRQPQSLGATLRQVQDILLQAGAVTAANLDGGSSTVLWYRGTVLNHPSSPFGQRPVPTAFLVMPAGFSADAEARANLQLDASVPATAGPIAPANLPSAGCAGPSPAAPAASAATPGAAGEWESCAAAGPAAGGGALPSPTIAADHSSPPAGRSSSTAGAAHAPGPAPAASGRRPSAGAPAGPARSSAQAGSPAGAARPTHAP